MNKVFLKKTWLLLKKIFLVIFIVHVGWFLVFIFEKSSVSDFTITNLKTKVFLVCGGLLAIGLLYYFWLRKIPLIKKTGIIIRELFFICYISSFIYLLLGMVFNPPITLTEAVSVLQGNGLKRDYISYAGMGPNIKLAVMASEDQNFPDHDGFDLKAIKLAIKYNKRHPNRVRAFLRPSSAQAGPRIGPSKQATTVSHGSDFSAECSSCQSCTGRVEALCVSHSSLYSESEH